MKLNLKLPTCLQAAKHRQSFLMAMAWIGVAKQKLHAQLLGSLEKLGEEDPKTIKLRKKVSEEFMELKLAPRMFEALIGHLRNHVNEIRQLEKEIMIMAVRDAGMPRKDFITSFPRNETNLHWLDKHVRAKRKHSAALGRLRESIEKHQLHLREIEKRTPCSLNSLQSSRITSAGVLDRRAEPISKNSRA